MNIMKVYTVYYETIDEAFTFSVSPERRQSQVSASPTMYRFLSSFTSLRWSEQDFKGQDELQVGGRSHVIMSAQLGVITLGQHSHTLLERLTHLHPP